MLEELKDASQRLCVALEHYLRICSSIQGLCRQGAIPYKVSSEYTTQVDQELNLLELYDKHVQRAKLEIKAARNYTFRYAPINFLPPETLSRIFYMVRDSDPCHIDRLALICSYWRSVALSSPSLWSRIDYHLHSSKWPHRELCARAHLHISRSGQLPLNVHVSVARMAYHHDVDPNDHPVRKMCKVTAPRMRSLELDFTYADGTGWNTNFVITEILANCTPGAFVKLVTTESNRFGFFAPRLDEPPVGWPLRLGVEWTFLEEVFAPITILHLHGIFPRWTSRAYHGLVDLRLFASSGEGGSIPEAQLIGILKASPKLRIFHFELQITHQRERGASVSRVSLTDLEVLHVHSGFNETGSSCDRIEAILRLLTARSRPLQLSIWCFHYPPDMPSWEETCAFFGRSAVSKLYTNMVPLPVRLLSSSPSLNVLILDSCENLGQLQPLSLPWRYSHSASYPRLDTCVITNCRLDMDDLLSFIKQCHVQTLTIHGTRFNRKDTTGLFGMAAAKKELLAICPNVRAADARPNLDEHWDLLL